MSINLTKQQSQCFQEFDDLMKDLEAIEERIPKEVR
jgi:hypothetical protein